MKPSASYSPDLQWWLRDSGASLGEGSAFGASLDRMRLYGRNPWTPDRQRTSRRALPGETDVIDPGDYFVAAAAARSEDRGPTPREPQYTAVPKTLGGTEPLAHDPDFSTLARARRVARAWAKLTPEQRHKLWLAYIAGIDWGTDEEHRAYRLAVAPDAERYLMELAHAA